MHNSTMASDASPRPMDLNMDESSAVMAQTSFYYDCMEVSFFKLPHPNIFD